MESFHYSINLVHSFKRKEKKKKRKWTTFGVGLRNITVQQSHGQAPPTSRYIMFLAQAKAREGHGAGMEQWARLLPRQGLLSHAGIDNAEKI